MKTYSKNWLKVLFIGMSLSSAVAQADINAGSLAAGSASNTDVRTLTCPIGTTSARASVNDAFPFNAKVSVQMIDPHGRATTQTTPGGLGFSGTAILNGGAGSYLVTVHKNNALLQGYVLVLDCFVGATPVAGDQSLLVQNQ